MLNKGDVKLLKDIIDLQMQDLVKEKEEITENFLAVEAQIRGLVSELSNYSKKLYDCHEKMQKVKSYKGFVESNIGKSKKDENFTIDKENSSMMNELYFDDILRFLNMI